MVISHQELTILEDWLKANNVKKYDYIKVTFEKVKIVLDKELKNDKHNTRNFNNNSSFSFDLQCFKIRNKFKNKYFGFNFVSNWFNQRLCRLNVLKLIIFFIFHKLILMIIIMEHLKNKVKEGMVYFLSLAMSPAGSFSSEDIYS